MYFPRVSFGRVAHVFGAAAVFLWCASPAHADLLVYEGFEVADGPLAGVGSGSGWADGSTWEETSFNRIYQAKSPGLTFPGLTTRGGFAERESFQGRGGMGREVSSESLPSMTDDNSEFWFSVLVRNQDEEDSFEVLTFLFSSVRLEDDNSGDPNHLQSFNLGSEVAVGFVFDVNENFGGGIRGIVYDGDELDFDGAAIPMFDAFPIESQSDTHLVVGHVEWGDGGEGHFLTLYALSASANAGGAPPVPLPQPIGSLEFDLDQTLLQFVTFGGRRWAGVDEIRFGTTLEDVGLGEVTCPAEGDTHCTGLTFSGPELPGGLHGPGTYTFTATGSDDSGDAVLFALTASKVDDPGRPDVVLGPQADGSFELALDPGDWTIAVMTDDVGLCDDQAADAICELEITVELEGPPEVPPAVVYEGFDLPDIEDLPLPLADDGSGFGWDPDSFWEETFFNSVYQASTPGIEFPGLAAGGGRAQREFPDGRGALGRIVGDAEHGRLTGGDEMWFSALVENPGGGGEAFLFLFSSIRLEDDGVEVAHLANLGGADRGFDLDDATGIGFVFDVSNTTSQFVEGGTVGIRGVVYDGRGDGKGTPNMTAGFHEILDPAAIHLVVGRVIWGEDGTGHQLIVYVRTPEENLAHTSPVPLGDPIGAVIFDLDPSALQYVTFGGRSLSAIDEIRLGTTGAEVGVEGASCPALGDTHCTSLTSEGTGLPGVYRIAVSAADDDGDETLHLTYVVSREGEPDVVIGPREVAAPGGQASDSIQLDLGAGTYTITLTADDSLDCPDAADDATCTLEVVVTAPPAPVEPSPLVYEGFEIPDLESSPRIWTPDDELDPTVGVGVGSGFGWEEDSVWRETAFNRFYHAKPGGLDFPGLLSKGGFAERESFQGRGALSRPVGEAAIDKLTNPGGEFWMSALLQNQDTNSTFESMLLLFSSIRLEDNNADLQHMVQYDLGAATAVGLAFDVNQNFGDSAAIRGVVYNGDPDFDLLGPPIVSETGFDIVDQSLVHLVAVRVHWSDDDIGHELSLFAVSVLENELHQSPVPMGDPVATMTFDMEPFELRFVTFGGRRWGGVDEIRLGTSASDVGVTFPGDVPVDDEPEFVRGDADSSGDINITDGISILDFLFGGAEGPRCEDAADADDSGSVNITDAVFILGFLFGGEAPPPPPHGECGPDPTDDAVECAEEQEACAG